MPGYNFSLWYFHPAVLWSFSSFWHEHHRQYWDGGRHHKYLYVAIHIHISYMQKTRFSHVLHIYTCLAHLPGFHLSLPPALFWFYSLFIFTFLLKKGDPLATSTFFLIFFFLFELSFEKTILIFWKKVDPLATSTFFLISFFLFQLSFEKKTF